MFASTFLSHLKSSTSQPLLPLSSTNSQPALYNDDPTPSPTDTTATLLALARQEAHLQSHIQYLLDVQSDRLLEGLSSNDPPASPPSSALSQSNANTNSKPPLDVYSSHHPSSPPPSTIPQNHTQRQTKPQKKPSLQSTRHQLTTAIRTLHTLKLQTSSLLSTSLSTITSSQTHITSLQSRKSQLESTLQDLDSSPLNAELATLASQEEKLNKQIYELENRLYEAKVQRGEVQKKWREGRNRLDASASSWKGTLELLEKEERGVLQQRAPVVAAVNLKGGYDGQNPASASPSNRKRGEVEEEGKESIWDLPPNRRTLPLLRDFYTQQSSHLSKKLSAVEIESKALEEGASVWEDVIEEVAGVERLLVREMRNLSPHHAHTDTPTNTNTPTDTHTHTDPTTNPHQSIHKILLAMTHAIDT
ncbi:MAG: hypothetical protein Q9168_008419, partial [Polycauliona sp. 1 TL-2023]